MAYLSPLASSSTYGVVKIGAGLNVTDGVISSTSATSITSVTSTVSTPTVGLSPAVLVAGMSISPPPGNYLILFNGQFSSLGTDVTALAAADITALVADLSGLVQTGTHAPAFATETITPGVYDVAGAGTLGAAAVLTLDGGGNPNALFVFRIGAAWSTGAGSSVALINSANAANVFWLAGGAASTGATSSFTGTMIAAPAGASTGAGAVLNGRLLSTLGAVNVDSSTITTPLTPSVVTSLGILSSFALFTANGQVANVGVSTINGDIGTNSGTVTGFGTSVVNGTIYTAGVSELIAEYGIYVAGVLIADSARPQQNDGTQKLHQTIAMQTVASVTTGQAVDVRVSVDIGTITTENRILSLIKEL